jgi:hypothetical protein
LRNVERLVGTIWFGRDAAPSSGPCETSIGSQPLGGAQVQNPCFTLLIGLLISNLDFRCLMGV